VLCALANGLKPGSIPDVSKGSNAFMQMQNIDKFLKACRNLFKVMVVVLVMVVVVAAVAVAVVVVGDVRCGGGDDDNNDSIRCHRCLSTSCSKP
jgi:hypothetical protein